MANDKIKSKTDFENLYKEVEKIVGRNTFMEITGLELSDYVKGWITEHQDISFTAVDIAMACEEYEYEVDTE